MQPRISSSVARSLTRSRPLTRQPLSRSLCPSSRLRKGTPLPQTTLFSTTSGRRIEHRSDRSYSKPSAELNNNITDAEKEHFEKEVAENKDKQIRTPWHREGSDVPPVARQRQASAMTKGKLLTTPSRMLKLILPLTTRDHNEDRKNVEPLALLVHPQQPLSYLERLIQSELPTIKDGDKEKIPKVQFLAEDNTTDSLEPSKSDAKAKDKLADVDKNKEKDDSEDLEKADSYNIDGKTVKTGKLNKNSSKDAAALRGGPGEGGVESYSGLGHEAEPPSTQKEKEQDEAAAKFVRWSSSTEVGDFIRDAARGREFSIEIEGAPRDIRVGVPSFNDRTYYLRMRLRGLSKQISSLADLKKECDQLAHKGAQRVALAGLGAMVGWWYLVYRLTFETELGWDVMEPVTYLVGLSTLMGGYVWFLYHNRDVSYRSAMKFTISRRQGKLYAQRGFDLDKWQGLIEDGNLLRKEIKTIANEYDVEWNEREDEQMDEKVAEALRKEREKSKKKGKEDDKDDDD